VVLSIVMATSVKQLSKSEQVIGIVSELWLWAVILTLLGLIFWYRQAGKQLVWVPFEDISQLQVGSPVNLMGSDIGYVTEVVPTKDHVMVQFETYTHTPSLPRGAEYTVEFNGLAGAKTLEVLPPAPGAAIKADKVIEEPIRLKDVFKTQKVMAQALESTMDNISDALGDVSSFSAYPQMLQEANRALVDSGHLMLQRDAFIQAQSRQFHNTLTKAVDSMNTFYIPLHQFEVMSTPERFRETSLQTSRDLAMTVTDLYGFLGQCVSEHHVQELHRQATGRTAQLKALRQRVQSSASVFDQRYASINQWLAQVLQQFITAQQKLQHPPVTSRVIQAKQVTANWAGQTRKLNQSKIK